MATGGEAVARLDDGRVVFVQGALPNETVRIELTQQKKRFARGVVIDVLDASASRIGQSCVHAAAGDCGGCDWQHIEHAAQTDYKRGIVVEQLQRLGGIESPTVASAEQQRGRRTTVRCAVTDGRAGYRKRRSDASFVAEQCEAAHPAIEQLIQLGRFGDATEVTLRVGSVTGERLVVTDGDPGSVVVDSDVLVASSADPAEAAIHEVVAGHRWRISALSFFQTSLAGAEALVSAVQRGLAESHGSVVDLYAGVGMLGGAAVSERLAASVESNASSSADARVNLPQSIDVVRANVERWTPSAFGAVIADPARRGLGAAGATTITGTGASRLVLVSCDPAALGRDTALLVEQGWRYDHGEVIDMFPDTSRIEVVSAFSR